MGRFDERQLHGTGNLRPCGATRTQVACYVIIKQLTVYATTLESLGLDELEWLTSFLPRGAHAVSCWLTMLVPALLVGQLLLPYRESSFACAASRSTGSKRAPRAPTLWLGKESHQVPTRAYFWSLFGGAQTSDVLINLRRIFSVSTLGVLISA